MTIDPLNIILILFGLFTLYGTIAQPDFYWNRGRVMRARQLMGDRNARIMYFATGLIMLGVGAWGTWVGF